MKRLAEQTLYEILEVPPDAPQAAVKAAIERAREIFGPGSLAMYSLMSPDEASLMNRRIEEAWVTLLDPEARARYDAWLGGPGQGATATQVATWTLPPVLAGRADAPSSTPTPGASAGGSPHAGATALSGPQTPLVAEPPSAAPGPPASPPDDDGNGAEEARAKPAEAAQPASPARAPLQLVTAVIEAAGPPPLLPRVPPAAAAQPPEPPPLAGPVAMRAPIRLDRPVSFPQPAMTPPPAAQRADPAPEATPPDFADDASWTGEMLRRVREARGIPIQIIAQRTKITRHHLENIEKDRFGQLPAAVYLRGILLALARELRLDGQKVARSYLERMSAATSPPPTTPGPKR